MGTFKSFLKNRWGHMIALFLGIVIVFIIGAIDDAKNGMYFPLITISILYVIYGILFYFDYKNFKRDNA
jgi:hypothetical protein